MLKKYYLKKRIKNVRDELDHLIEYEELSSSVVQKQSQKLDVLIISYYRQYAYSQHLKEP